MFLQRLHNAELVFGGDAGVNGDFQHGRFKLLLTHLVEHDPRFDTAVVANAQIVGDKVGREGVVARNHNGADARLAAGGHGRFHFGAGRVYHAHQPHKSKVSF